ncbi:hypothetical protein Tco_0979202, partial [Tanacetum coccineum]
PALVISELEAIRRRFFWGFKEEEKKMVRVPLKTLFQRLYALKTCKTCLVADRRVYENGVWFSKWSWRRQPNGRANDK